MGTVLLLDEVQLIAFAPALLHQSLVQPTSGVDRIDSLERTDIHPKPHGQLATQREARLIVTSLSHMAVGDMTNARPTVLRRISTAGSAHLPLARSTSSGLRPTRAPAHRKHTSTRSPHSPFYCPIQNAKTWLPE